MIVLIVNSILVSFRTRGLVEAHSNVELKNTGNTSEVDLNGVRSVL